MKLSFTTLGCPAWDLEAVIRNAVAMGFDGVDFRGLRGDMNLPHRPEFSSKLEATARLVRDAGLAVSAVSCGARLCHGDAAGRDAAVAEVAAYAPIAEALGAPFIRVFGGQAAPLTRDEAVAPAAEVLTRMAAAAGRYGVGVVVETHDDWVASHELRRILDAADNTRIGVLWDVHHPYRLAGEAPGTTWEQLGARTVYTHWKDSRLQHDGKGYSMCLMGEGDVPLKPIHRLLINNDYKGWYAFEWEKVWHPEIAEPEEAFPHFVRFMRTLQADG